MARTEPTIIQTCADLDAGWLERALAAGPVASFAVEEIGTGQMSLLHRVAVRYADPEHGGPESVVLKVAASDPTSRATGIGLGIYSSEIRFYQELAPRIGGPLAACLFASFDETEGWFTLLLEDVAPAEVGDQIAGCTVEQAHLAMRALARLHAPVLGDPELAAADWLNRPSPVNQALVTALLPGFLERYGEQIEPEHRRLCERLVAGLDAWLADRREPLGLVHGDFRLDNLLFGDPDGPQPLTVVDWQTVGWGPAMGDAAYFLGGGLLLEDRRAHELELLREYHEQLRAQGAEGIGWEECYAQYRRGTLGGVLMAIVASMLVERTERGDEMFMTMLARHSQHALDMAADELLPSAASAHSAPAPVRAQDEGRHAPEGEQLWNESWYLDAVSSDGSVGAYVRVGLYPNMDVCWYTAFVCGPGRPTVAVVDFAAPLPEGEQLLTRTDALRAELRCPAPLERMAVALAASGEAYADPAAILRAERGEPIPVALELEWRTAGIPYGYRLTTRYEIPCSVGGTIRVGEELIELKDAVGQRDHSWGARDWWSMDWVWSAGHLDDGTHLHAVELRLPNLPTLGVGYVQSPGAELLELERVSASEQLAPDGLIERARLVLEPGGLELAVEPLAFGPLRLLAPDGRVSHFPRAMCRIACADGRSGLAWVEWNLNQPPARPPGSAS